MLVKTLMNDTIIPLEKVELGSLYRIKLLNAGRYEPRLVKLNRIEQDLYSFGSIDESGYMVAVGKDSYKNQWILLKNETNSE